MTKHLQSGDRVGRFILHQRLGDGATADVFLARDPSAGEDVALKITRRDVPFDLEVQASFENEAAVLDAFRHSGVPRLIQLGEDDLQRPFIAMTRVPGSSLAVLLRAVQRRDPAERWARVLDTLLPALSVALRTMQASHDQGVLHRDLKPANLMVDPSRRAVVVDWGLAGPLRQPAEVDAIVSRRRAPMARGTIGYISPERLSPIGPGEDPRSDQWSMGSILYEVLTGSPAIQRDSLGRRVRRTLLAPPQHPCMRAPHLDVPVGLAGVAVRALAIRPCDRFVDLDAMRMELDAARLDAARLLSLPSGRPVQRLSA